MNEELQQKRRFAELIFTGLDPFDAAAEIFPDDSGQALQVSVDWVADADVLAMLEEIEQTNGGKAGLPNKENYARAVWKTATDCGDPDYKIKAQRLYGEVMGYIEKGGTNVNIRNTDGILAVNVNDIDDIAEAEKAYKESLGG